MLETLHVKNLAIIDEAEVEFEKGLNILTGETGAGKSVIIGSINLALGEKASRSFIRENADYALVELIFRIENENQKKRLKDLDIDTEEDRIILSRKVMDNRNICKINSETVSVSSLRAVADILIDIHGQHEHQSLLHKKNHLRLLDDYAKEKLAPLKKKYSVEYGSFLQLKKEYEEANLDASDLEREVSFLEFEISEIEGAQLQPGEDENLEQQFKKISHMQKIIESLSSAYQLTGEENAATSIEHAFREISSVRTYDERLEELCGQLEEVDNLLNDFDRELSSYLEENEFDQEEYEKIEVRLNEINRLKTKYGKTIEEILEAYADKQERLSKLLDYTQYREKLEKDLKEKKQLLLTVANEMSIIRKQEAKILQEKITSSLLDLNFAQVQFEIHMEQLEEFGASGMDSVEFLICTNPGERLKPLEKVASGGELSRIMLALKSVCAENDQVDTLIFDEIDTGISGRTAQMVSEKMNVIAKRHQVICITHLPQIAAMADTHYLIEKSIQNEKTISSIEKLSREESVEELARMLGGVQITDVVRQSANEMKDLADRAKIS